MLNGISNDSSAKRRYGFDASGKKLVVVLVVLAFSGILSFISLGVCMCHIWSGESQELTSGLGRQMRYYARDNMGAFPAHDSWCKILESEGYYDFSKKREHKDGCGYAVNPEAIRLGHRVPDDMVLMFPAEKGWNLSGDYQLVRKDLPLGRIPVLLADYSVKFYREHELAGLRWKALNNPEVVSRGKSISGILCGLISFCMLGYILFKYYRYIKNHQIWFVLVALVSGMAGSLLGFIFDEMLYCYHLSEPLSLGWLYGLVIALLCELYFCGALTEYYNKLQINYRLKDVHRSYKWQIMSHSAFLGLFVGIGFNVLVHVLLMVGYGEVSLWPFSAGLAFGSWAGVMLGITNAVFVGSVEAM